MFAWDIPAFAWDIPMLAWDIPARRWDIPAFAWDIPARRWDIPAGNWDIPVEHRAHRRRTMRRDFVKGPDREFEAQLTQFLANRA